MSRRTARPCVALVVMAAAGVLAGPAAGQSSVWYNRDWNDANAALTTDTLGDGTHASLFVACTIPGGRIIAGLYAGLPGTEPGDGPQPLAFRFDGDPETETVAMAERLVDGEFVSLVVSGLDAMRLTVAFRSSDHDRAETGAPGGTWVDWTLRGAAAAIDRLPCWGGAR